MRLALPHVVVALQQHAATLQHLRKLQVHFRAQEFRDRQPRQQVDRHLEFLLGAIERGHLQLGQRRFPRSGIVFRPRRPACLIPHPRRPLGRLRSFGREQSFQLAVAGDQPRNLRPSQLHKLRTQQHIVPQVIDADRESLERDKGRRRGQIRRRRFLRRST